MLVHKAHRVVETSTEAFILRCEKLNGVPFLDTTDEKRYRREIHVVTGDPFSFNPAQDISGGKSLGVRERLHRRARVSPSWLRKA